MRLVSFLRAGRCTVVIAALAAVAGCSSENAGIVPIDAAPAPADAAKSADGGVPTNSDGGTADATLDGSSSEVDAMTGDAMTGDVGDGQAVSDGGSNDAEARTIGAMACTPANGTPPASLVVSTPFAAPNDVLTFTPPTIPCQVFNITDYGAVTGGTVKNTAAFSSAVTAASNAGGGVVEVPAGSWLTGPIHLADNIELHVEAGATVLFSTDFTDYGFSAADGGAPSSVPLVLTRWEGLDVMNGSPLVYCLNCTNVAITGSGTLYGQGAAWWNWKNTSAAEDLRMYDAILTELGILNDAGLPNDAGRPVITGPLTPPSSGVQFGLRPTMVECNGCTNFLIQDVTIKDGPYWIVHPLYSENVIVRGAHVVSGQEPPLDGGAPASNGDGLDPDSCKHVLIEDTDFTTSDDNIAVKSGLNEDGIFVNRPSEEIVVRRITSLVGHGGMTIGSEMSGGIHNVYATDSALTGTGVQFPLRYKTLPGRGGTITDIWYDGITLNGWTQGGIIIDMAYASSTLVPFNPNLLPRVGNIAFSNISGPDGGAGVGSCPSPADASVPVACPAITLRGQPGSPLQNISFTNVNLAGTGSSCVAGSNAVSLSNVDVTGINDVGGTWVCP